MSPHSFADRSTFRRRRETPIAVQIISTLVFGGFAITATVMAFVMFWPAGFVLAVILGWRGGFGPSNFTRAHRDDLVAQVRSLSPEAQARRSGNTSFDAYRDDVLTRLEQERHSFDGFLGRLRDAKDQTEFDRFMDERAQKAARLDGAEARA